MWLLHHHRWGACCQTTRILRMWSWRGTTRVTTQASTWKRETKIANKLSSHQTTRYRRPSSRCFSASRPVNICQGDGSPARSSSGPSTAGASGRSGGGVRGDRLQGSRAVQLTQRCLESKCVLLLAASILREMSSIPIHSTIPVSRQRTKSPTKEPHYTRDTKTRPLTCEFWA